MPRLLLVDDNPSIHRIAESLLAPTDVELVCVDSAAEALDRLARGERFDVALVDTAMPGMDGWTLLTRLRAMDETALMPIALMAGVLDPVDPAKLAKAPIQGFLKKPIELRELGDRVKALLNTPVVPPPSPFSTVPSTPARDLVKRAEEALPELRHPSEEATVGFQVGDLNLSEPEEDLLVLTAEDLWPEGSTPVLPEAVPALPDVHLELEELDLESLQDLTNEPFPESEPAPVMAPPVFEFEPAPVAAPPVFEFEPGPVLPEEDDDLVTLSGLDDLESFPADYPEAPMATEPLPDKADKAHDLDQAFAELPAAVDLIDEADLAAIGGLITVESIPEFPEPAEEVLETVPEAIPESAPWEAPAAAGGQAFAVPSHVPGQAAPLASEPAAVSPEQARAVVQALLADPVLVDALVKAVVSRMGDQVLREIAWEVMPDLAGRLQQ